MNEDMGVEKPEMSQETQDSDWKPAMSWKAFLILCYR